MELIRIEKLQNASSWSDINAKVIMLTVDTKKYNNLTTNNINEFSSNLEKILPTLYNLKYKFPYKMKRGIPVEEVIGEVAKELQVLAGLTSEYIITDKIHSSLCQITFSYTEESAGVFAGKKAVEIVETLVQGKQYHNIELDIHALAEKIIQYK